jgi:hypothetical protein
MLSGAVAIPFLPCELSDIVIHPPVASSSLGTGVKIELSHVPSAHWVAEFLRVYSMWVV